MKSIKSAAVFNGGGVKCVAFTGALLELESRVNIELNTFCGTSGGAIIAAVLAMGYDAKTTAQIIKRQSFSSFLEKNWQPSWNMPPWRESELSINNSFQKFFRNCKKGIREFFVWFRVLIPNSNGALYSSAPIGRFIQYLEQWRPYSSGELRVERDQFLGGRFCDIPKKLFVIASSTGVENTHTFMEPTDEIEFAIRSSSAIPAFLSDKH